MAIREANENNINDLTKEGFVLVDAYGDGCAPCAMLAKVLEQLEFDVPFMEIVKINTSTNREFSKEKDITGVPTMFFMKDGEVLERQSGFLPLELLKQKISKHMY